MYSKRFVPQLHSSWLVCLWGMLVAGPASAQSLASDFSDFLNNLAQDCNVLGQSESLSITQSDTCFTATSITPRTDLEMRSAAPEEFAAQKSMVKEFSAQQMKNIAGRLSDLRTSMANLSKDNLFDGYRVASATSTSRRLGGGASADDTLASPFNMFANIAYGFGNRDQTVYEDRLRFHGSELTVGGDYRLDSATVIGAAIGYSTKRSRLSSNYVDAASGVTTQNASGKSDVKGMVVSVYGQWESNSLYVNGSFGNQWLSHDLQRSADYYSSGNPVVPLIADAATNSTTLQASFNGGYVWHVGSTSVDAAVNAQYQNSRIDGFKETGAVCPAGACSVDSVDFNMQIDSARIKSTEASVTVRVQHAYTPSYGVLVPFVSAELIKQLDDKGYVITGMYESLYGVIPNFNLATDKPDTQYYAASAGLSFVRQGGWQGFLKYRAKFGLDNVSDSLISAGVRKEF